MDLMQVIVDGMLTNYEMSGRGRTVVLLHGWGDQATGFTNLRQELTKHFNTIVPDLPGFGGTDAPKTKWGIDEYVTFIAALLKKLKVIDVYAIIGHSNGGAIAIRGVARKKLRCEKLILLASAGIRGEYKGRLKALQYITKSGKALTAPLSANMKRRLRQKVYQSIGSDMLIAEHMQETFKAVVTDDVRADAVLITVPTLLIYGEADTQTPLRYGELFHELIQRSTLEILPGAGHALQLDRPRDVYKAIEEFLR